MERPILKKGLDSKTFKSFYYLKEELVAFCRENKLPVFGGKIELTERIAHYLDTGEVLHTSSTGKKTQRMTAINEDSKIEENIVCSEVHRAFFKEHIGKSFSFNVAFQKWLKANAGKTYKDAIVAYDTILKEKKQGKKNIDRHFDTDERGVPGQWYQSKQKPQGKCAEYRCCFWAENTALVGSSTQRVVYNFKGNL